MLELVEGDTLAESNERLAHMGDLMAAAMERTGRKLLWGTANLFSHRRYMSGAATNPDPEVFAYGAAQVRQVMEEVRLEPLLSEVLAVGGRERARGGRRRARRRLNTKGPDRVNGQALRWRFRRICPRSDGAPSICSVKSAPADRTRGRNGGTWSVQAGSVPETGMRTNVHRLHNTRHFNVLQNHKQCCPAATLLRKAKPSPSCYRFSSRGRNESRPSDPPRIPLKRPKSGRCDGQDTAPQ